MTPAFTPPATAPKTHSEIIAGVCERMEARNAAFARSSRTAAQVWQAELAQLRSTNNIVEDTPVSATTELATVDVDDEALRIANYEARMAKHAWMVASVPAPGPVVAATEPVTPAPKVASNVVPLLEKTPVVEAVTAVESVQVPDTEPVAVVDDKVDAVQADVKDEVVDVLQTAAVEEKVAEVVDVVQTVAVEETVAEVADVVQTVAVEEKVGEVAKVPFEVERPVLIDAIQRAFSDFMEMLNPKKDNDVGSDIKGATAIGTVQ